MYATFRCPSICHEQRRTYRMAGGLVDQTGQMGLTACGGRTAQGLVPRREQRALLYASYISNPFDRNL